MTTQTMNGSTAKDDGDDNVIQSLVMLEALKKTKNVRQVVINELRRIAAQTADLETKCVLLAAADLLEDTKKKLKNQSLLIILLAVSLLVSACASEKNLVKQWNKVSDDLTTGHKHFKSLAAINNFVNGFEYKTDIENYGVSDYWASPKEFFANKAGDCEDYVIAKYALALEAGLTTSEDAKLALVFDRRKGLNHMVLIIKGLVLDNQNDKIITVEQAKKRYNVLGEVRDIISQLR